MKHLYLLLCTGMLLAATTPAWAEPLGYEKREMGKGPRGNTPQMQFYDAAEEAAEDKYATIVDPDEVQELKEQPQPQEQTEPEPPPPVQQ